MSLHHLHAADLLQRDGSVSSPFSKSETLASAGEISAARDPLHEVLSLKDPFKAIDVGTNLIRVLEE